MGFFDATVAKRERDVALKKVSSKNTRWMEEALRVIKTIVPHQRVIGEDIRKYVLDFHESPTHPNAWGALIRTAVGRGYLEPTGRWLSSTAKKSHACKCPEYYRTNKG